MKPLGYYNLDYDNDLISDIAETWGECLQNMVISDQCWLISVLYNRYLEQMTMTKSEDIRPQDFVGAGAIEVIDRVRELNQDEVTGLIKALVNQNQPLGYWGLDIRENALIEDIRDTWGDRLLGIDAIDQAWLVAELSKYFWSQWGGHPSNEAQETCDRMDELDRSELTKLIEAIANK